MAQRKAEEAMPETPTVKSRGRPRKTPKVEIPVKKTELKLQKEEFAGTLDLLSARFNGKPDNLILSGVDKTKS